MSEMTRCNYCSYHDILKRVGEKRVELRDNTRMGGVDVFVDGKWVAWFMQLSTHCVC